MNAFLELDFADRQLSCKAVQTSMGLHAASVEKDFWVCWTLRELFTLPGIGQHLTFKGGTSLSKAWQLDEETFRPADKPRKLRMARHYYDLWCLLKAGVGERALTNTALFQRVAEHREIFFRYSWVDYSTHKPGTFRLSPPAEHLPNWRSDYQDMLGPMFFGDVPTFDQMMTAAAEFEKTFNATA